MTIEILSLILLGVIIAFTIYIFRFPPSKSETNEVDLEKNKDELCMNYASLGMNQLSAGLVHNVTEGYDLRQGHFIKDHPASNLLNDARAIWFDLEILKAFIYNLEMNTRNNDPAVSSQDLGLRLYYASYPEASVNTDPSKVRPIWGDFAELDPLDNMGYESLHTLVMIPTIRKGGKDLDFNPLQFDTYAGGLMDTKKYTNSKTNGNNPVSGLMGIPNSTRAGAQNHGSLYPPQTRNGLNF